MKPAADVTVLIPVLGRPDRAQPVLESLVASESTLSFEPVFLCSPADRRQIAAVLNAGAIPRVVNWNPRGGDYARKMNLGFEEAETPWVFLGADDLSFRPGWATEAIAVATLNDVCVVGTNDLGNQRTIAGTLSTHTLVHRDYGECGVIDDPSKLLHEGYDHNFVDEEFVGTAKWRGTYAHAPRSIVEHLHPSWGKGTDDDTYRKGMRQFAKDRRLSHERSWMWTEP